MSNVWEKLATNSLKAELARKGINYPKLVDMLNKIGVQESVFSVKAKINRGTFQFAFFLQCAAAIGLEIFRFEPIPKEEKNS